MSIDHLSFIGARPRHRRQHPRRMWCIRRLLQDKKPEVLGRELAAEFLAWLAKHPERTDVLPRIVASMPTPLDRAEIAFLAAVKAGEVIRTKAE